MTKTQNKIDLICTEMLQKGEKERDVEDLISAIVEQFKDYHHTAEEIVNSEILISVNHDGTLVTRSGSEHKELIYLLGEMCQDDK